MPDDRIVISDRNNHRIQFLSQDNFSPLFAFGSIGSGHEQFNLPLDVWYDSYYDHLFVADKGNNRVKVLEVQGDSLRYLKEIDSICLSSPSSVASINTNGIDYVYIADTGNGRVVKVKVDYNSATDHPLFVWEQYKNALRADDIESAVQFINQTSQDIYREILLSLQPYFTEYITGMGQMEFEYQHETDALYEMLHDEGGVMVAFPVYFVRDINGAWKIEKY
ncbi:MAG: hypothetical protein JW745_01360 [Sedimentisphaerales bacterium]|nr:hypothetical protein [Sedimentisphaerales bacterium]MBN2843006.1 hypothetical protein [Sedimentisphaerales bacterium]